MTLIEIQEITKTFNDGTNDVDILKSTTVSINANEFTAIVGPSGSGKSTLLTILGALQTPTSGTITIDDKNVGDLDANQLSSLRFESIGFVLQASNLVPYLTVYEQFEMKYKYAKLKKDQKRIDSLLEKLGISDLKNKYPDEISGGERQRVAIGTALLLKPKIILADEPTASLDTEKSYDVIKLLKEISVSEETAVVMVTHDKRMLKYCDRVLEMNDGVLKEITEKE